MLTTPLSISIVDSVFSISRTPIQHQGKCATHSYRQAGRANSQQVFSQSSFEAEVISRDACLRLERIPALNLWDLLDDFLESPAGRDLIRNTNLLRKRRGM